MPYNNYNNYIRNANRRAKTKFENGKMSLLGSKFYINIRMKSDSYLSLIVAIGICIIGMAPILILNQMGVQEINSIISVIVSMISKFFFLVVLFLIVFDADTFECYTFGYDKSIYHRATGVNKYEIARDKGLIGEYKSYVLHRKIKVPHKVLFNVCVPMPNGNYQEVDAIIITNNIIYVLECKNRGGRFVGNYEDKKWKQYIGSQVNDAENIYIQNQKHTMAIDRFLLERGIISNGQNVCMNVVFSSGNMSLPKKNIPLDFIFGDMRFIANYINRHDKVFDDGTDTTQTMEKIYHALLPYSLYTKQERAAMLEERKVRSERKELAVGDFYTEKVQDTKNGTHSQLIVRHNKIYTQIYINDGKSGCWQTRTDLGRNIRYNRYQISKGVGQHRVQEFLNKTRAESPLIIKKCCIAFLVVSLAVIVLIGL
ncbi:MAG: nuclease-related domain-containing protein [Eubacteriales bacterium]|nr:nuclease-related domain-containing protein [Eubacteriales bacterium]